MSLRPLVRWRVEKQEDRRSKSSIQPEMWDMKLKGSLYHRLPHRWPGGSRALKLRIPESEVAMVYSSALKFTIKKQETAFLVMLGVHEAVMHSWEFINHLGEAAMGLTFGKIRVRPTLCPTLQDFLTCSFGSCLL